MTLRWTTTDQAGQLNGVKVLVYSDAGMGKTTLCATAPDPLIISAESGLLSVRRHKIPVIEVTSYSELYEAWQWASSAREAAQFQTICLDSISEIAERVLEHAKKANKDPRAAYGELANNTFMLIRAFRDIRGKHVYMSAKQDWSKDDVTGVSKYGPMMPGRQLGPGMPYYYDEVFNLNVGVAGNGQKFRYLRTQPDLQYTAKDRSGSLAEIEPPDLSHIFKKIMAG